MTLGIETSGEGTGLALLDGDTVLAEHVEQTGTAHNEVILPLLERLFQGAGRALSDVTAIGVTIGPGMFSSLRVGLSVAKGLAFSRNLPVKGIGTLRVLAETTAASSLSPQPASSTLPLAPCISSTPVLSVIDARKSQVYAALYLSGRTLLTPCVLTPSALPATLQSAVCNLQSATISLSGSGTPLCLEPLRSAGVLAHDSGIRAPSPSVVARVSACLLASEGPDDPERLEPVYLRRTDAELSREKEPRGR